MLSLYDKTDLAAFKGPVFQLHFPLHLVMKACGKDLIAVIERRAFHQTLRLIRDPDRGECRSSLGYMATRLDHSKREWQ